MNTRKRLLIVIVSIAFSFCFLFVRLGYVQIVQGKWLQSKAASQWYRDLPLSAPRGKILDCNGSVLADNKDVYTVYVRPNAVTDADAVCNLLSDLLKVDRAKLYDKIKAHAVSEITVARNIDVATGIAIRDAELDGIYLSIDSARNYTGGNLLSQVIGFTNIDNVGQNGIEGYYDQYLRGVNGLQLTSTDIKGKEIPGDNRRYIPAVAGCNVSLTIDSQIQAFAEDAVTNAVKEWNSKSASMLVMDCNTGGILAMAISPSFDLNDIPRNDIDKLNALSKNTLVVDVYEPGSTFKIFTTATAIEAGVVSDSNRFYCPGYRMVDGQRIRCWRSIGHGSQNLSDGVMNSCNCVFMDLALKLGTERLYNGLHSFGFGSKTNIDFYGESSGILMPQGSVKNVDLARIGFGQAVAVTPLQLITAASAVVNGGTLYEPYLVSQVNDTTGKCIYTREPKSVRQVISKSTSEQMRSMLGRVVSEGSGKKAQVEGLQVGGKTGTAQKYVNGTIAQGKYVSSFLGFAPLDNPQYVVLMIVDEPSGYVYYGSQTAAPYAGQVLNRICDYIGYDRNGESIKYTEMPELSGLSLTDAIIEIDRCGLQYEMVGEGTKVIATVPKAGTRIPENDIILIRLQ